MTGNLDIMLYDYENIWENIVYIQAREGSSSSEKQKRRVKKWRKLLKFPPLIECQQFAEQDDKLDAYNFVVGKQPIGARLFNQFCLGSKKKYYCHTDFLRDVEAYELELEDNREKSALEIIEKYLGTIVIAKSYKLTHLQERCCFCLGPIRNHTNLVMIIITIINVVR